MKNIAIVVVATCSLLVVYFFVSPIVALDGLRDALDRGNSIELDERVDFPRLRQSLKDQFNTVMLREMAKEPSDNPFGALALAFATKLVDGAVESFVTPAGLASMSKGNRPAPDAPVGTPGAPDGAAGTSERELFENARISRDSLGRFSVFVPGSDGNEMQFVFRREGMSWRLTDILLPLENDS